MNQYQQTIGFQEGGASTMRVWVFIVIITLVLFAACFPANAQSPGIGCDEFGPIMSIDEYANITAIFLEDSLTDNNLAFAIDSKRILFAIDLSIPTSPLTLPPLVLPIDIDGLIVEGDMAYLILSSGGVFVVDVSDPSNMSVIHEFFGQDDFSTIHNGIAFAFGRNEIKIVDLNGDKPVELSTLEFKDKFSSFSSSIYVNGNRGYVRSESNVFIIDLSDLSSPSVISQVGTERGAITKIVFHGDTLYTSSLTSGVTLYDISDEMNPTEIVQLHPFGNVVGMKIKDGRLYLAAGSAGVQIFDVVDPSQPTLIGSYFIQLPSSIQVSSSSFVVKESYVFASFFQQGIQVFDTSSPSTPYQSDFPGSTGAYDIDIVGDHAYVVAGETGFLVYDISDQQYPELIGGYNTPGIAQDLEVAGEFAYIADGDGGLSILDISDPRSVHRLGWYHREDMRAIKLVGELAYIATANGLEIMNVSEPTFPRSYASFYEPRSGFDLAVQGKYVFLGQGVDGLSVINVEKPI